MSLADAFNKPILHVIDGKEYRLAFLTMDDLAGIARETLHEEKLAALKLVAVTNKEERDGVNAYFDALDLDMNALARQCMTLKGSTRFVRKALLKAGHPAAEAETFIAEVTAAEGYMALGSIACRVSRLFKPVKQSPNVATPPAGNSDGGETNQNQSTGEPSATTPVEPLAEQTPAA